MLTGTDVCTLGIVGAMMGAVLSAGAALETNGFFTILKTARNYVPEEVPLLHYPEIPQICSVPSALVRAR